MAVTITLNGRDLEAKEGQTILEAAKEHGVAIPTLCHQDELKPFSSCFICVVQIEGVPRLVPSCATPVANGMVVETDNEAIRQSRRMCLELMLSDHWGDCRAPCQVSCPAGIDVPGFIALLAEGRSSEAVRLIKETMPFPASLGRICPRFCEDTCRRRGVDEPISICFLHRFVADEDAKLGQSVVPSVKGKSGKRVAIVGAGPAGLSCAFYLAKEGHEVTVLESQDEPGGMMRYGIPSYRLPTEVLDREIDVIRRMGVDIRCGVTLGRDMSLDDLHREYDAVFIAIGAWSASSMRVEGEREAGVLFGIEFLWDVATGKKVDVGDEVIVVGGGNTAIDAARTSLRLGAKRVKIYYRRTREEMPADDAEIEAAVKEGVEINFLVAPVGVRKAKRGIELTCVRMELGEPDESGRRRPVPIKGSEFKVTVDAVIAAIGQNVDARCLDVAELKLKQTKWSTVEVDEHTFLTNGEGVFAGGDCVSGPDVAVTAIAAGRKAAWSIHQYLQGERVVGEPVSYLHSMGEKIEEVPPPVFEGWEKAERAKMPELPVSVRIRSFDSVETGYTAEDAKREAERCMACGCRTYQACSLRTLATEYGAQAGHIMGQRRHFFIDDSHPLILYEAHKCITCGSCVRVCSEVKNLDALGFVQRGFATTVKPILEKRWVDSTCDTCLKCVTMCPTGAISLKVSPAEEARVRWEKSVDASKDVAGKEFTVEPKIAT